jgi:hypothetical protein
MVQWNRSGVPVSIALPYIYFTQGFLTGALQQHARKHVIPIDKIDFAFEVTDIITDEEVRPSLSLPLSLPFYSRSGPSSAPPPHACADGGVAHPGDGGSRRWLLRQRALH